MIPNSNNSRTRKKTMLNILDSATNCAPIVIDIGPRFEGIANTNGAVENEPKYIILFILI